MTALETARRYLDAWNARDAEAIVRTFAPNGSYTDPTTPPISGDAIGANARRLWSAFPDLSFEIVMLAEAGPGRVVAEWLMKGTNTGAFMGLPASGRTVALPGVDLIDVAAEGITAVKGFFDSRALPEQLGLQVLVQPFTLGPFAFGFSTSVQSGKKNRPGAFGITTIWNDDAQTEEIRNFTRATAMEMREMQGFIGLATLRIGSRGVTISAWETPEDVKQLRRTGSHPEAMRQFWSGLGDAAFTSVWVPDHIHPMWVRCPACRKMIDHAKHAGVCGCGAALPEPPAYF